MTVSELQTLEHESTDVDMELCAISFISIFICE